MLSSEQFLLYGEPRIVVETATMLARHNLNFFILDRWPTPYTNHPATLNIEHNENASESARLSAISLMGNYKSVTVTDLDQLSAEMTPTIVLDLCYNSTLFHNRLDILRELIRFIPHAIVLASTLTCTATHLKNVTSQTAQIVGFNAMPGWTSLTHLELAPSIGTSPSTSDRISNVLGQLGFKTEVVEDRVGLVLPRVLAMLINEAAFAVMEKVSKPTDIDTAVKLGVNYPHGLLEWGDMLGLDCVLGILDALYDEYHDPRYRACVLLRQYVRAGLLGKETGEGFFTYP